MLISTFVSVMALAAPSSLTTEEVLVPLGATLVSLAAMTTTATLVSHTPLVENLAPPVGGAVLAALPMLLFDLGLGDSGSVYGAGGIALALGAIGSPFAAALGSWGLGSVTGPGGNYWAAFGGAVLGELLAVVVHFIFEKLPEDPHFAIAKLAIESSLVGGGATIGYQLSRPSR